MNIGKIIIYSLTVNACKKIFDEEMFEILDFKENEDATAFDIELANVRGIDFLVGNLLIYDRKNNYIRIETDDYKEIKIPWESLKNIIQ